MKTILLLVLFLLISIDAHAARLMGPHGGDIIQNESHLFEVDFDSQNEEVNVYTLGADTTIPRNMSLVLYRNSGKIEKISLAAVRKVNSLPTFQGQINTLNSESFIGAELRFEVGSQKLKAVPFVPHVPIRNR